MSEPARRAFGLRPLSIAGKFRLVITALAAILVGICATVVYEVHRIRTDLRRVAEERREAELAQTLLLDLEGFERVVRLRRAAGAADGAQVGTQDQLAHLDSALAAIERMADSPQDDPSEREHAAAEAVQRGELHRRIAAARGEVEAGRGGDPQLHSRVAELRQVAEALAYDVAGEAHRASLDLDLRGGSLMRVVVVLALFALLVLIGVCLFVARGLVRPLQELRAGARVIGSGRLDHPLPASRDEIGDLAREINAMAQHLARHRRELQQRVEERTRELIRSARLADVGTVAAGLAHEINTPLSSIVACAEGLLRRVERGRGSVAEQREYLNIIAREADRVREITSRLLEIARPAAGELGAVSVADAVRAAVMLCRPRFSERGIALQLALDDDLPPAHSHAQELRQVLLNLLGNALDASPVGGAVTVRARRHGPEVVIEVDDQGPGVPAEVADRIFDPFFTTKDAGHGTGLGLAIVQRIVERHGGHIDQVNLDPGARFRVRLAIAASDSPSAAHAEA